MAAPRKYPDELRERAIRLVLNVKQDPATRPNACKRIGASSASTPTPARLGDAGRDRRRARPGTTTSEAQRIAELEREVKQLRANAILRSASAFFAAELDRPQR